MKIEVKCKFCGKDTLTWAYKIRDGTNIYCSSKCGRNSTRKYGVDKKKCTQCKEIKERSLSYFYSNKDKHDGFATECKDCYKTNSNKVVQSRVDYINSCGKKCVLCGIENDNSSFFELDHIIPRWKTKQRADMRYILKDLDNIQILCPNCHKIKTINDNKECKKSKE